MGSKTEQRVTPLEDLQQAYDGSYYTILGAGGDPMEWVTGVEGLMAEEGIGKPTAWYSATGQQINDFADRGTRTLVYEDAFQNDLNVLLFPLDGLETGKLAIFKIRMQDRWFDDIVDNMRDRG